VLRTGRILGEGSVVFGLQIKLNLTFWCIWRTRNHKKWIRIEKVMAPKLEGVKNLKKQTNKHYKPKSDHPKKSLYVVLLLLEVKNDL
jgi:hypothetical protein